MMTGDGANCQLKALIEVLEPFTTSYQALGATNRVSGPYTLAGSVISCLLDSAAPLRWPGFALRFLPAA
jgi:hypothetical protein